MSPSDSVFLLTVHLDAPSGELSRGLGLEQAVRDAAEQHLLRIWNDCTYRALKEMEEMCWHVGKEGAQHRRALATHGARLAAYTVAHQRAEAAYKRMQIWRM